MSEEIPAQRGIELGPGVFIDPDVLRYGTSRSSGPGGQNVNKVNTKVEVWVPLPHLRGMDDSARARLVRLAGKRMTVDNELHLVCESHRSQEQNKQEVLEKLRGLIVEALKRPRVRRKTRPSRSSQRQRIETKRRRGGVKKMRGGPGGDD